jgi:hypothetical protein
MFDTYDEYKTTDPRDYEPSHPSIRGEVEYRLMQWEDEHGPRCKWSDGLKLSWNNLVERIKRKQRGSRCAPSKLRQGRSITPRRFPEEEESK